MHCWVGGMPGRAMNETLALDDDPYVLLIVHQTNEIAPA